MTSPAPHTPDLTETDDSAPRGGILSPAYLATTVGMFAMVAFNAFEAMAVTTVMPTIARDLGGLSLYSLAFAAPLATGVIGMVVAGMLADRSGPRAPALASMALFSLGLLLCAVATTMPLFLLGRLIQGLGGGAVVVCLYVLVGLVYPARLRPGVFASFAAAWVLPALFGPGLAAAVAHLWGWRWVFGGVVVLVGVALVLLLPALRRLPDHAEPTRTPVSRLGWATLAALGVLTTGVLGTHRGAAMLGALLGIAVVVVAMHRIMPAGTLRARPGLPAVIGVRGLLSATFFAAEAYLVYVLQERWDLTPGQAGIALTCVGVSWAIASQLQARLGTRVTHARAMLVGSSVVGGGVAVVAAAVIAHEYGAPMPAWLPAAAYVVAGMGMGFAYPRTGTAMLDLSTDADRGFNSSALSIADQMGAALSIAIAGMVFAAAGVAGVDGFAVVYAVAALLGGLGVWVGTRAQRSAPTR